MQHTNDTMSTNHSDSSDDEFVYDIFADSDHEGANEPEPQLQESETAKHLHHIANIESDIKMQQSRLELMPHRIAQLLAHCAGFSWMLKSLKLSTSQIEAKAKALQLQWNRLAYDAGMAGENTMRLLLKLDAVQGTEEVRQARKARVKLANTVIERSEKTRTSIKEKKLPAQVLKLADKLSAEYEQPVVEVAGAVPAPTPAPTPTHRDEGEADMSTEETASPRTPRRPSPPPAQEMDVDTDAEAATPPAPKKRRSPKQQSRSAKHTPPLTKKQRLFQLCKASLPRAHLRLHERSYRDAISLQAELHGAIQDSIEFDVDESARTATIRGVFASRHSARPAAWFEEELEIPSSLSIKSVKATVDPHSGILEITIPRVQSPPRKTLHHPRPAGFGLDPFGFSTPSRHRGYGSVPGFSFW